MFTPLSYVGLALLFAGLFGSRLIAQRATKLLSSEEKLALIDSFSFLRVFSPLPILLIGVSFFGIRYLPEAWTWPAYFGDCALLLAYFAIIHHIIMRRLHELGVNASYRAAYKRVRLVSYFSWIAFLTLNFLGPFIYGLNQETHDALRHAQWIPLDAEQLAETGIRETYEQILPQLKQYVPQPASVEELIDNDVPSYSVKCGMKEYAIYDPKTDEKKGDSWGRATFAFFSIVNDQLAGSEYKFYATNGGNDLGGVFLMPTDASDARETLPNRQDWPYIPTNKPPWYGQYHN
jgi:hypothetical protein